MSEKPIKYEGSVQIASRVSEKDIDDYLFGTETNLTEPQKTLFKNIAIMSNLNPFKREIYAIPYERRVKKGDKWVKESVMTVVTGYQVYVQRAEATGLLGGWSVGLTKEGSNIISAKITIIRKDWSVPFEFEILFNEFAKRDADGELLGSWKTMPSFMITKCAIGIGFRLSFPNELGGMPYLAEEMSNMTFEQLQEIEKEMIAKVNANKNVELMSRATKLDLFALANNSKEVVMQALNELGLEKDKLLESDKEIITNKIKEILNANNTNEEVASE